MPFKASLTGHLVLSTLHTNSAVDTIVRLLEMGMDEFNFADALLGVLSQRLIRTLCASCKTAYTPDPADLNMLAMEYCRISSGELDVTRDVVDAQIDRWKQDFFHGRNITLFKPSGCKECLDTGYRGRMSVYELLTATTEVKKLILRKATSHEILSVALSLEMKTIMQDGIIKVIRGFTDYAQVRML